MKEVIMSKDAENTAHPDESGPNGQRAKPSPRRWLKRFLAIIVVLFAYGLFTRALRDQPKPTDAAGLTEVAFSMTDEAVLAGEKIYGESCSTCHGDALEGGIGPSFLDDNWTHGADPETVVRIITDGVPENGMLAWESILTEEQIRHVAAYVLGTNQDAVGQ